MALLLAVHAHPDDESLWTGALLATWAREGEVELVTCTRGERGEVIGGELAHLEGDGPALAAHREGELARAVAALGVQRHSFLDALPLGIADDGAARVAPGGATSGDQLRLEDSGMAWLADGVAGPAAQVPEGAFVRADIDDVASTFAAYLATRRPAVVVTYGPDGGYGHPDHVRAHEVTIRAVERLTAAGGPAPVVLWATAPDRLVEVRETARLRVEVALAPVLDVVAAAMRSHATQVQSVVVGPDVIDFALSNDVPLRLGPVEVYEPAPGTASSDGWPDVWPVGVEVHLPVP